MTVTVMILFGSSFFTDVIGVHAIFGTLNICCFNCSFWRLYPCRRLRNWTHCTTRRWPCDCNDGKIGGYGFFFKPNSNLREVAEAMLPVPHH